MLFIVNTHAGRRMIVPALAEVISMFNAGGYETTVYITQKAGDVPVLVESDAYKYDAIVCAGGDGTLNEAVRGLMHCEKRPPLGFIPAGTNNDAVANLGLPRKITDAAKVIVDGFYKPIDIGQFNDMYFDYIAAFGNLIEASFATPREAKNAVGGLAYVMSVLKLLPSVKPFRVRAEYDDGQVFDDDILIGMTSNGKYMASISLGEQLDASIDDGLMELIFIKKVKDVISLQNLLESYAVGEAAESDGIFWRRVRKVRIQTDEAMSWTLDGEYGGTYKTVNIINHMHAVNIFVPQNKNK